MINTTVITTLLFDWGGTVMAELPEYSGPMAYWPQVEAIPGTRETLEALSKDYRIALASNAIESTEALARQALGRAGLGGFFERVFTARQLGLQKPDPAYYQKILTEMNALPEQVLMVGDSYLNDVAAAKRAGLRAAWYNPDQVEYSTLHPLYDLELDDLAELPGLIAGPLLPDIPSCQAMLAEQGADRSLQDHCLAVAGCAFWLAVWLREAGQPVDPLLSHRGGMLHDLDKISARQSGEEHGRHSQLLLEEAGYPILGEIAARHVINSVLDPQAGPRTWEEKLVFYADKLIEGARLVGVESRHKALLERYPQYSERINRAKLYVLQIEAEICSAAGLDQLSLNRKLAEKLEKPAL
jgi:HAD superfamily hydrolase (TIGR01662 family)